MKQIPILILISMLLISCSKEDNLMEQPKTLFGIWNSISFQANEPLFDVNNDGINATDLLDELPCRYSKLTLHADYTFLQINNTWSFEEDSDSYVCTTRDEEVSISGTWAINSEYTLLSLTIDGNTTFLEIEFDGEVLQFNSSEIFLDKNAQGESKNVYGRVSYARN